jgi:phosphopentomutase
VIDSFGIGHMPDADRYGDVGANTAKHICDTVAGVQLRNLERLGLGNCARLLGHDLCGIAPATRPLAGFGAMAERSPGKDTTTGHWELAGVVLDKPFQTFPKGPPAFPDEILKPFCEAIGTGVMGNESASGTEIIERLGKEHLETGRPIVYTSADSVFQIATHETVVPVVELYRMCEIARKLCDPHQVGRVIARPFNGSPGSFERTERRRDFSIALPAPTVLDRLAERGIRTVGVGKIGNIFNDQGLSESYADKGNPCCLERTRNELRDARGDDFFLYVNLVDTDMLYGHRRDAPGYYHALREIDDSLPGLLSFLDDGDLFIISADHGCDPTFRGNDHTREYVPLLACRVGAEGGNLGVRSSFADVAQSVADYFGISPLGNGTSFL